MRILPLISCLSLLSAGAVLGRALPIGQDAAGQEVYQDTTQPGPVHEAMAARAGSYTTTSVIQAPGQDPVESKGTAKIESILGGRFLLETTTGDAMGQPYESVKLWGYNNDTDELESVWVYTMGTGMMTMKGKAAEDGPIVCAATWTDAQGAHEAQIKLSFPSETSHVVTMTHEAAPGVEVVWSETYTPVRESEDR